MKNIEVGYKVLLVDPGRLQGHWRDYLQMIHDAFSENVMGRVTQQNVCMPAAACLSSFSFTA